MTVSIHKTIRFKKSFLVNISILVSILGCNYEMNYWTETYSTEVDSLDKVLAEYQTYKLKFKEFKTAINPNNIHQNMDLLLGVIEHIFRDTKRNIIPLPMGDGTFERFEYWEAPVMDSQLQEKYQSISTFAGQGIDNPRATTRFEMGPNGLSGMILTEDKTVFINPLDNKKENYICFRKKDLLTQHQIFEQDLKTLINEMDEVYVDPIQLELPSRSSDEPVVVTTFRLALAGTGEYSRYF